MRIAIIDLGTNSVRFDVHQFGLGKKQKKLHAEKLMVRLGQGVFTDGRLAPDAVARTLHAFASFKKTAQMLSVEKTVAFATSALREATDAHRVIQRIFKTTGIEVKIISGEEEARLIAAGILKNEKKVQDWKTFALVDIGGGSVEISICQNRVVTKSASFDLGAARLQQVFLKTNPPRPPTRKGEEHPIRLLRQYIRNTLESVMKPQNWPEVDRIVGSSGTIRALVRLTRKMKKPSKKSATGPMDVDALETLVSRIQAMTTTQLLGVPGMESRRVDMVLAGAILFEEIMHALRAKKAIATEYSLRDGILAQELKGYRRTRSASAAFDLEQIFKATRPNGATQHKGFSESHVRQVDTLATRLFDELQFVHRLHPQWRLYLQALTLVHDWGKIINPIDHELHSHYMVKNADFLLMEEWEREFLALLCLYHRTDKVAAKDLPFGKNPLRKKAFLKLLAIFQIADALDRNHRALVTIKRVRLERMGRKSGVRVLVSGKTSIHLELLRVEQKKALFEKVFQKKLVVEQG